MLTAARPLLAVQAIVGADCVAHPALLSWMTKSSHTTAWSVKIGGMAGIVDAPSYATNIYTIDAILDPYPHYRRLRELGPVVWLPRHKVSRYRATRESKATLRDDDTFRSTGGVALNRLSNRLSRGTTLASDGAERDRRRKLVCRTGCSLERSMPSADQAQRCAGDVVDLRGPTGRCQRGRPGHRAAHGDDSGPGRLARPASAST